MSVPRIVDLVVFAPLGAIATAAARISDSRHGPATDPVASPAAVGALHDADPPPADVPADALAIEGYDYLAASQVIDRLSALTGPELAMVADYERGHRRRQIVLGRIAQLRA